MKWTSSVCTLRIKFSTFHYSVDGMYVSQSGESISYLSHILPLHSIFSKRWACCLHLHVFSSGSTALSRPQQQIGQLHNLVVAPHTSHSIPTTTISSMNIHQHCWEADYRGWPGGTEGCPTEHMAAETSSSPWAALPASAHSYRAPSVCTHSKKPSVRWWQCVGYSGKLQHLIKQRKLRHRAQCYTQCLALTVYQSAAVVSCRWASWTRRTTTEGK